MGTSKTKALREALLLAGTALQEAAKAIVEESGYESRIAALEARLALLEGQKREPTAPPRSQIRGTRGQLLQTRDAAARIRVSVGTMHRLAKEGIGPPAHKRPGSNRWHYFSNDIDAWLESGRVNPPPADGHSPTTGQTR